MQNQTKYLFILISQITDNTGKLLAEQSFDAWGRIRDPETWEYTIINNQSSIINSRGYTAHEMSYKNFVLGARVITNAQTEEQKQDTHSDYISPFGGKIIKPNYGTYDHGEVWSSPLMIGYKTDYGVIAFEHNNPIYQRVLQNSIHNSKIGKTPFFQSQPYNYYKVTTYRQNPFSIYFY